MLVVQETCAASKIAIPGLPEGKEEHLLLEIKPRCPKFHTHVPVSRPMSTEKTNNKN